MFPRGEAFFKVSCPSSASVVIARNKNERTLSGVRFVRRIGNHVFDDLRIHIKVAEVAVPQDEIRIQRLGVIEQRLNRFHRVMSVVHYEERPLVSVRSTSLEGINVAILGF